MKDKYTRIRFYEANNLADIEQIIDELTFNDKWKIVHIDISVHPMKDYNYNDDSLANQWEHYVAIVYSIGK